MAFDSVRWMEQMGRVAPDFKSKKLNELILPGSHDSAAYGTPTSMGGDLAGQFAEANGQTIKEQLEGGLRFFDLRFADVDGEFHAAHSSVHFEQTLKVVLQNILEYMQAHAGELIAASFRVVTAGNNDDDPPPELLQKMKSEIESLKDCCIVCPNQPMPESMPTLGALSKENKYLLAMIYSQKTYEAGSIFWPLCFNGTFINSDKITDKQNGTIAQLCEWKNPVPEWGLEHGYQIAYTLTPQRTVKSALATLFGGLKKLAETMNPTLPEFIRLPKVRDKLSRVSTITLDWYETHPANVEFIANLNLGPPSKQTAVSITPGKNYYIQNVHNSEYLTHSASSLSDGREDTFVFLKVGDTGRYYIKCNKNDEYLTSSASKMSSSPGAAEEWNAEVAPGGNDHFYFRNISNGQYKCNRATHLESPPPDDKAIFKIIPE